ncbi:ATP-binding protein [Halococcoides cellulosivorans]|uniref:ATPase n=1 Tax=Halococcoides cellulosivorans TaxID=1679096 RepID=A0A2R4WYZ2_9EURY|nr:ATP-binding protein [Halococcoides cellulosivorans]AWB26751.1 ATPase [Halococcoides cellulosivorans]
MTEFVNRTEELDRLRDCFESDDAELVVVYGRRRLGKTRLVKQALREYDETVFYQARQKTRTLQIEQFVETAAETVPGIERIRQDWEPLIEYLAEQDAIVVLDEFPYLIEQDESLPSVLQALFDHEFAASSGTIVLVGSSISMMEEATLLGDSPLYGRSSLKLDVRQLPFDAAVEFLPEDATPDDSVRAWSVFGGVPYYLEELDPTASLGENIHHTALARHGSLHSEPEYVLRMELQEPTRYFSILEAIAGGATGRNDIAGATGIEYNQLSTYLDRLTRLRLIERRVPVTERPERSKRSQYRIRDPYFRFWFRFLYGSQDRYAEYGAGAYDRLIEPAMGDFVAPAFEELCCRALWTLYDEYPVVNVGQWWYQDHEIDVVGLTDEGVLVAGECKYQSSPADFSALSSLERHVEELRWTPDGGGDRTCEYALFSRSGFSDSLRDAAADRSDLRLFSLADVVETLTADRS